MVDPPDAENQRRSYGRRIAIRRTRDVIMHEHQIPSEYVETLVIGGGQAGLAVGH